MGIFRDHAAPGLPYPGVRTVIGTFLTAAVAGTVYEIAKDLIFPHITLGHSQAVTIVVIGLAATVARYAVLRSRADWLSGRETEFRLLFASNPLPMWLYDLETLGFLEINDAAIAHYGYSRAEFLRLNIADIRPAEDIARLNENLCMPRSAFQESGPWRHRLKDGQIIWVQIASHLHDRRHK